jgi:hypothetical protein
MLFALTALMTALGLWIFGRYGGMLGLTFIIVAVFGLREIIETWLYTKNFKNPIAEGKFFLCLWQI